MWKQLFLLLTLSFSLTTAQCGPRIRRSWYALTDQERVLFVQALNAIKRSGEYDIFTWIHTDSRNLDYAHGKAGFFVWHRKFLFEFENALRSLGPQYACITIPYWPFETEAGKEAQSAIFAYFGGPRDVRYGCNTQPNFSWRATDAPCIVRNFDSQFSFIGEARMIDIIVNNVPYGSATGFRSQLEGSPHAAVHNYIGGGGGHMGAMSSPNDPLFYLHHANIDRLFAIWNDCHDHDKVTPRVGTNSWPDNTLYGPMPFFYQAGIYWRFARQTTPFDVFNIQTNTLPYSYDLDDRLVGLILSTVGQCKFDIFAPIVSNSTKKRDAQQFFGPPRKVQYFKFTDSRVQSSYDSICTVEIPYAPKIYQIHVAAIAECNICTGHGEKKYATDAWIAAQNMLDQKSSFVPICKPNSTNAPTQLSYTAPQMNQQYNLPTYQQQIYTSPQPQYTSIPNQYPQQSQPQYTNLYLQQSQPQYTLFPNQYPQQSYYQNSPTYKNIYNSP